MLIEVPDQEKRQLINAKYVTEAELHSETEVRLSILGDGGAWQIYKFSSAEKSNRFLDDLKAATRSPGYPSPF